MSQFIDIRFTTPLLVHPVNIEDFIRTVRDELGGNGTRTDLKIDCSIRW